MAYRGDTWLTGDHKIREIHGSQGVYLANRGAQGRHWFLRDHRKGTYLAYRGSLGVYLD